MMDAIAPVYIDCTKVYLNEQVQGTHEVWNASWRGPEQCQDFVFMCASQFLSPSLSLVLYGTVSCCCGLGLENLTLFDLNDHN